MHIERLENRQLLTTFVVTSSADTGLGTLRAAITAANTNLNPFVTDVIDFDISRPTPIDLASPLPTITQPLFIDGTSQTGYAGTPLIQLVGTSAGASANGLTISSTAHVTALCINRFSGDGIHITSNGNTITACRIGTDTAGATDLGNGGSGIYLDTADSNTIGGATAALRNIISGNAIMGIYVLGSSSNSIEGNYIGTNAAGTAAIPNGSAGNVDGFGIYMISSGSTGSNSNVIGGSATGIAGNLISGNLKTGIYLTGGASGNSIVGNLIGTNAAGTAAIPNATGVAIGGSTGNTIGGITAGSGNVISGNIGDGISLNTFLPNVGDTIQGNSIGTDITGAAAVPNGSNGINILSGQYVIGGIASGGHFPGNLISGNSGNGILLSGEFTSDCTIYGNAIGTQADRVSPLGNAFDGVQVTYGSMFGTYPGPAHDNSIGGASAQNGNVIAFNGGRGVEISGIGDPGSIPATLTGNLVRHNSIFSNVGLGIDLRETGPTPNDPLDADTDGGNNVQNYPVINTAGGPGKTVVGQLNSAVSTTYTIDFYSSPTPDPTGYGQGKNWLGSTTVTTNSGGLATFNVSLPSMVTGTYITATATDPGNNTSEFSQAVGVDLTPLKVTGAVFTYDLPSSPWHRVDISFSEYLSQSTITSGNITFQNLTTGHTLAPSEYSVVLVFPQGPGNILEFFYRNFGINGPFPDGNYRITLSGAGITDTAGNLLDGNGDGIGGDNYVFDFFFLTADANHNRTVDIYDLRALSANFGQPGKVYSQGDFDCNGIVNSVDLGILASHWQSTLPAAAPALPAATSGPPRRAATRVIDLMPI